MIVAAGWGLTGREFLTKIILKSGLVGNLKRKELK